MAFNSLTYLAFLPLVVLLYWAAPGRARLWLVFVSSLVFYGFWRIEFIPLMLLSAGADYLLARMIERSDDEAVRRRLLIVSIGLSLTILGVFKYLIFLTDTAWSIAGWLGLEPSWPTLHIVLPLGISFYIFATISYVVDVYRRVIPAEKGALTYFCFVTFFPHLAAGPILRAGVLIPQLKRPAAFSWASAALGTRRILEGLFLKVVLADNIGALVDRAFAGGQTMRHGADAWTMAFLFGFQIYFDFSAYSHIAIGSALLMGIVLPKNFDFPYFATSPREFWKRWHISLSTWVRDYLYMPLMGARPKGEGWEALPAERGRGKAEARRTRALFITWTLMGFWHGANWTFGLWGLLHAAFIQAQRLIGRRRVPAVLAWGVTLAAVMAAWIPFRAAGLGEALALWSRMVDPRRFFSLTLEANSYVAAAAALAGMTAVWGWRRTAPALIARPLVRAGFETAYFAVVIAFVFVYLQVGEQFIYFQF